MNTSAHHRYKRSHCQTPAGSQLWAPKQEVKNANRSTFFGKQGRKQATCSHFLCPPGSEGSRAHCTRVALGRAHRAHRPAPAGRRGARHPASRSRPPYLLSPGLGPGSRMPAEEGTVPPPVPLSALELWAGVSGPAGAKVLPSGGGSGGWKAGDTCFLVRVPPRR